MELITPNEKNEITEFIWYKELELYMAGFVGWDTAFFTVERGENLILKMELKLSAKNKALSEDEPRPEDLSSQSENKTNQFAALKTNTANGPFHYCKRAWSPSHAIVKQKELFHCQFLYWGTAMQQKKKKHANTGHTRCTWTEKQRGIDTHTHHNFYHHRKNVIDHKKNNFSESFGRLFPDDWHPG